MTRRQARLMRRARLLSLLALFAVLYRAPCYEYDGGRLYAVVLPW